MIIKNAKLRGKDELYSIVVKDVEKLKKFLHKWIWEGMR